MPFVALYCRRPILDAGYYACLHKPNVGLSWKSVREVTKTGLLLEDGTEEAFDVIILSTGFITVRPAALRVAPNKLTKEVKPGTQPVRRPRRRRYDP